MAKKPNYTARRTVAAGLASGAVGAAYTAHSEANPEWVPQVTQHYVDDPNGSGSSILTHTYQMVEPHIPAASEIAHHALTAGATAAAIGAGATLGYHAVKAIKNRNLGRQFGK